MLTRDKKYMNYLLDHSVYAASFAMQIETLAGKNLSTETATPEKNMSAICGRNNLWLTSEKIYSTCYTGTGNCSLLPK